MGAIVHPHGVTFRVWAPFADSVAVAGDFNVWASDADPLASEGNGIWATDVAAARAEAQRFAGILRLYRDLIRLRRNGDGPSRGLRGQGVNVHHVNEADKLIAFHRWDAGGPRDDVVVVVNAANRAYDAYRIGLPRGGLWRVRFNNDWRGYGADFGDQGGDARADGAGRDGMPASAVIGIGPYAAIILSQDE